jgi:hypothetical protein
MNPTRRGFLKMLGAAAAIPVVLPANLNAFVAPPAAPAVPSAIKAGQLASKIVRDGYSVLIRALPSNAGAVYLGSSEDLAKDRKAAFALEPGSDLLLHISNLNHIWMDTDDGGTIDILEIRVPYEH